MSSPAGREDFERPFFASPRRVEQVTYLRPSTSVGGMSVGRYRSDGSRLRVSDPNPLSAVYYLPVALVGMPRRHAWRDGKHQRSPAQPVGNIASYDLRHRWETELSFPFDTLNFYVPQRAFDELTEELRQPPVETLSCTPVRVTPDPPLHHLALALAATLDSGLHPPSLLTDQILGAVRLRLATQYGQLRVPPTRAPRLTREQVARLKELLLDDPSRDVRMSELAAVCGLPSRAFGRAFRDSFGSPPHQWRLAAKVESARKMLELTDRPLTEIALLCGFTDQSHLTRVFTRAFRVPPGAYRRARRG